MSKNWKQKKGVINRPSNVFPYRLVVIFGMIMVTFGELLED